LDGPLPKLCPAVTLSHQDGHHSAVVLLLKAALIQVSDYRLLGASGLCSALLDIVCLFVPFFWPLYCPSIALSVHCIVRPLHCPSIVLPVHCIVRPSSTRLLITSLVSSNFSRKDELSWFRCMVFNTTFNNILVISWRWAMMDFF
jgi:hypothetical protein